METPVTGGDGSTRHVECLLGRHKLKKSYEYEVKWKGMRHKHNTWMEREKLVGLGFGKLVQQCDDRESLVKVNVKGVTSEIIQEHFTQFGLDEETSTHKKIRGLSGGQKVKLVLAAAFWHHPHLIVFDEPTNYLDRDSLSALASGINTFEGGVLVISHNEEFIKATCNEKWHVEAGAVRPCLCRVPAASVPTGRTSAFPVAYANTNWPPTPKNNTHTQTHTLTLPARRLSSRCRGRRASRRRRRPRRTPA